MIRLNGMNVNIERFPNNEICIRDFVRIHDRNVIELKFESNEDLLNLMFVKKHIDEKEPSNRTVLEIPYLPYSRMDRTEGTNVFTLKYLAQFINSLNFDKVMTYEAHSNVSLALFDRMENENYSVKLAYKCMGDINFDRNKDYIVFPDDGAKKRYAKSFGTGYKFLTCSKARDFLSGRISKLELNEEVEGEFKAIIVDDLCSYGGTFSMASETLKRAGASEVYLCVTHAEDGLFLGKIFKEDYINKVYTTNSLFDLNRIIDNPSATILDTRINVEKLF